MAEPTHSPLCSIGLCFFTSIFNNAGSFANSLRSTSLPFSAVPNGHSIVLHLQNAVVLVVTGLHLNNSLSCSLFCLSDSVTWGRPSTPIHYPFNPKASISNEGHSSVAPHDFFMVQCLSYFSWTFHATHQSSTTWEALTYDQVQLPAQSTTLVLLTTASVCWCRGNTSQKIWPHRCWSLLNHSLFFSPD